MELELTPQRLHAELLAAEPSVALAYLYVASHDATTSRRHATVRFGQSDISWLVNLRVLLSTLNQKSWMYRKGSKRSFWVLETSNRWAKERPPFVSRDEQLAYARGYFDAEGGVPRSSAGRFYIQLVQKNESDLQQLKAYLEAAGIRCGKMHNPSAAADKDLWRFYVLAASHAAFAENVSSWHLRKRLILERQLLRQPARMKI
jgi:hypothetical protein